jgi:Family of unknown function (DUF6152)
MRRSLHGVGLTVLILGATIEAHHAISAIYDNSKPITLRGTVTEFQFVNPHPFVMMEVGDERGHAQTWQLEMDNRFELVAIGMTADSLKKGDRVVVTGGPARSRSNGLYVLRLDREADGLRYEQIGASPRITRTR